MLYIFRAMVETMKEEHTRRLLGLCGERSWAAVAGSVLRLSTQDAFLDKDLKANTDSTHEQRGRKPVFMQRIRDFISKGSQAGTRTLGKASARGTLAVGTLSKKYKPFFDSELLCGFFFRAWCLFCPLSCVSEVGRI